VAASIPYEGDLHCSGAVKPKDLRTLSGSLLGVGGFMLVFSLLSLSTQLCAYRTECVTVFHTPTIFAGVSLIVLGIVALLRSSPKGSPP